MLRLIEVLPSDGYTTPEYNYVLRDTVYGDFWYYTEEQYKLLVAAGSVEEERKVIL